MKRNYAHWTDEIYYQLQFDFSLPVVDKYSRYSELNINPNRSIGESFAYCIFIALVTHINHAESLEPTIPRDVNQTFCSSSVGLFSLSHAAIIKMGHVVID